MSRLVLRFKDKASFSTDLLFDKEDPTSFDRGVKAALAFALQTIPKVHEGKEVVKVEAMVYEPEHKYAFRATKVPVDLEKLNARLNPRPADADLEEAA